MGQKFGIQVAPTPLIPSLPETKTKTLFKSRRLILGATTMKRTTQILACIAASLFSIATVAADFLSYPENEDCTTLDGRLKYIRAATENYYEATLQKIEGIPADTERFLESEYNEALSAGNEARFNLVYANTYFFAWRLKATINDLIIESKEGFTRLNNYDFTKEHAHQNEMLFYTSLLGKNFSVKESFTEYLIYDSNRDPSVLTSDDNVAFSFKSALFKGGIDRLITCSFSE